MAGKLSGKYMDQLEQWIGTGPKQFELLYSIMRDGCNATTFHQKCDGQGPTVTVLYNQQGTVYGAYTALNWDQSGAWKSDGTAFMFRLQLNGTAAANKFAAKTATHAIYCPSTYGPAFGDGHDLFTFQNSVTNSGGYFALNGYMKIGNTFDPKGVSSNDINNGNMNVNELEVYKVTDGKRTKCLDKPWRNTPEWNMKFLQNLKSELDSFSPPFRVQVPQSNILIIGPVGAGKSSFFNTIASVFRGRVTGQAPSGCAEHSITSHYSSYQVRSCSSGKPLKFRLCDTRGLEETQGIDANDVSFLLDGNVPDGYLFNPSAPISPEIPGFKKNTTLKDKIHCVCIVIDGSTAGILPEKMLEKIKGMQAKMHFRRVPQMVLLTKVDKICPEVESDTSKVYKSEAVLEQVNKISQLLGIPRNYVLPVKNYETEIELSDDVNILALLCLRQLLRASEDYMFNFLDQAEQDSDSVSGLTAKD